MAGAAPLAEARGLVLETDGRTRILDGVSFSVRRGEVLALVGESGCGKTMACLSLLGLNPPTTHVAAGGVFLGGAAMAGRPDRDWRAWRGGRVAMIFQDATSALNPVHRIGDALIAAVRRHGQCDRAAAASRARELLAQVGLPDPAARMRAYPHQLSGGMNQRVMIALALAGAPDLLIADEPTTALDVTTQRQILDLLASVQAQTGMAMILVSHDLGVVAQIADRVAVMYCGRVVEEGPAAAFFAGPAHPYAAGLLASMPPDPDADPGAPLRPIPGAVAPLSQLPRGCHFHPRCAGADELCREQMPPRRVSNAGERFALCHHPLPGTLAA